MGRLFLSLISILILQHSNFAFSQEIPRALDIYGEIMSIDRALEGKLGIFSEYPGFQEARLYQISDSLYVLEIFQNIDNQPIKIRKMLTASETADLRKRVTDQIIAKAFRKTLNQEGRVTLLWGTTSLALGYYGWAVPAMMNINDGKTALAVYMLTSGTAFYLPLAITRDIHVTRANAHLGLYGATRGIGHGILLGHLLSGDDLSFRGALAMGTTASIIEGIVGFKYAGRNNLTLGSAGVIGLLGDYGIGMGLGMAHIMDFYQPYHRGLDFCVLLGSGAGLFAGKLLSEKQPYTYGDMLVLNSAGLLGTSIPIALLVIADAEEDKAYSTAAMLGAMAGLYFGDKMVTGKNFSSGQGFLVMLSEFSGALTGAGIARLISNDEEGDEKIYAAFSTIGGALGYSAMYRAFRNNVSVSNEDVSFDFGFNPVGMLSLFNKSENYDEGLSAPMLLSMSISF